jgi:hypothetical protein
MTRMVMRYLREPSGQRKQFLHQRSIPAKLQAYDLGLSGDRGKRHKTKHNIHKSKLFHATWSCLAVVYRRRRPLLRGRCARPGGTRRVIDWGFHPSIVRHIGQIFRQAERHNHGYRDRYNKENERGPAHPSNFNS